MRDRKRYPIVCRVSMRHSVPTNEGKKYRPIQFYTGMSIAPEEWDSEAGRACTRHNKEKGQRACIDHLYINSTLERLYDRCRLLTEEIRGKEFDGVRVTLEQVKELFSSDDTIRRLRGATTRPALKTGVLDWLTTKNEDEPTTEGTKKSRRNTLNHLRAYHEATYPATLLCWETFTREYIEAFRNWLITDRGLGTATTNKQIRTLTTFLGWAKDAGKATAPTKLTKLHEEQGGNYTYLRPYEIDALCTLELEGGEQDTRDWFVLACCTGIRVSDLLSLTADNLVPTEGKGWSYEIRHRQQKTGKTVSIPVVVPQAVQVMERLGWKLPTPRTAPYLNRTIKKLAKLAGLNAPTEQLHEETGTPLLQWEAITMHTGRRSFATNAYLAGVPLETIRTMTGHSDLKTLEIYLRQTTEEKKQAFANHYVR